MLTDTAVTNFRLITRQRDRFGKRDLQDIFKVFLETDSDNVPKFVARDLHKLPPLKFDSDDVIKFLKDQILLQIDVTFIPKWKIRS